MMLRHDSSFRIYQDADEIVSAELIEGEIHIVKRFTSSDVYLTNPVQPCPDKIEMDVYVAKGGKIVLDRTVHGEHTPGYRVPEKITIDTTELVK